MYQFLPDTMIGASQSVKRLSDNAFIPMDEQNSDYAAFLKYQAEGGKVYAADETLPEGAAE